MPTKRTSTVSDGLGQGKDGAKDVMDDLVEQLAKLDRSMESSSN